MAGQFGLSLRCQSRRKKNCPEKSFHNLSGLLGKKCKAFLKIVSHNFAPEKLAANFTISLFRDLTRFLRRISTGKELNLGSNGNTICLHERRRNNSFGMIDEETLAQMNGKYVCPPDAGPAWRAAAEYGFDMSLIEDSLKLTPEQRLAEHQQALNFLIELQESSQSHGAE